MKTSILIAACIIFISIKAPAQNNDDKLVGYWMESEIETGISLSTLLVFNKNKSGEIEGSVFFMKSENQSLDFPLARILLDGNKISFEVQNTSISFTGLINDQKSGFSGTFLLEGKTAVQTQHQKLDDNKIREIVKPEPKCQPRKQIDHISGLMIG